MEQILFVCQHGGAKSLIAAEQFTRLARECGLQAHGVSAGLEPYDEVPPGVVHGLAAKGIDVSGYIPRALNANMLTDATTVIHFGCDMPSVDGVDIREWKDVPMVSDGFDAAHADIVGRVKQLVDEIRSTQPEIPLR
jgi:arsenate reductase (thioredoxin)